MGLFDNLGDISMGYLARQREVQDKEADEAYQQNKSSIGNLSKFWTAAMEGARNDPEVQQALLSRIAEVSQLDPRKKNVGKDIARLGDASLLWQGVKRSPESMQPKMDTMQAEVNAPAGPIIPMPQPTGLDFSAGGTTGKESTTPLPGPRSGMQQAAPLPMNLESNIPLPAPPTEYLSVYPTQDELDFKKYGEQESAAQKALARALALERGKAEIQSEFATEGQPPPLTSHDPKNNLVDRQGNIIVPAVPQPPVSATKDKDHREIERNGRRILQYFDGPDPSKVTSEVDAGPVRVPVFQQQMNAAKVDASVPAQFQNAIDSATIKIPTNKIPQIVDNVERRLKSGDVIGAKQYLRLAALRNEPVDVQNKVTGRREATRHMEDIGEILKTVPTGMLQGTVEQTANYLGKTTDPKLKALASRLVASMQSYRRSITGAAFNAGETTEYSQFWPGFKSDLPTNQAMIKGLTDKFNADDDTYWFNVFHEPGWSDADVNARGGRGGITPPNPPGGSTGGGATAAPSSNRTRIKVQP